MWKKSRKTWGAAQERSTRRVHNTIPYLFCPKANHCSRSNDGCSAISIPWSCGYRQTLGFLFPSTATRVRVRLRDFKYQQNIKPWELRERTVDTVLFVSVSRISKKKPIWTDFYSLWRTERTSEQSFRCWWWGGFGISAIKSYSLPFFFFNHEGVGDLSFNCIFAAKKKKQFTVLVYRQSMCLRLRALENC